MVGRLTRLICTVLIVAVGLITPVLVTGAAPAASADTVVNGCTIVSNPTPTHFTNCPNADFGGSNLSGLNLSFANLSGSTSVQCEETVGCSAADLWA